MERSYSQNLTTCQCQCCKTYEQGHTTYTIYCQAEDREFERVQMVFLAMTTSLLNELDEPNDPDVD